MDQVHVEQIYTSLSAFEIYSRLFCDGYGFMLDSSMPSSRMARYSIIGVRPFLRLEAKDNRIATWEGGRQKIDHGNPFDCLRELLSRYRVENNTGLPMVGGGAGYFSYDLCHHIEKLPRTALDDISLPDIAIGFYDGLVVADHCTGKTYAVSAGLPKGGRHAAMKKIKEIKAEVEAASCGKGGRDVPLSAVGGTAPMSNFTREEYCSSVERAREYIRMGDIYQVNLSQRFTTGISQSPIDLYADLRRLNPAPFAAYLDCGGVKVLSSSPERFLLLQGRRLETRPIKGTWARGRNAGEDLINMELLRSSEKDRAENLMIVDLMRNDIGKVCSIGSVRVPELFLVESYATVHHLVSTVTGELREGCDAVDCIKATFPGGSITGAPKIRAMQIIDELEPTCRSVYTGSIGYIGFDGNMDLNIAIRTILVKGQTAYYQVGGGIVWDSVAESEYRETLHKGLALNRALTHGHIGKIKT